MMSRLSSNEIQQLIPLLGSLARLVTNGSQLGEGELRTLLLSTDLEYHPMVQKELKLWGQLLKALRAQPTSELRLATVEALLLRSLPEASVLLAVDAVTSGISRPTMPSHSSQAQLLRVNPPNLDLGLLAPKQTAIGTFEVQGGPGRVMVESDQLRVTPLQFGVGTTRVRVEARPLSGGTLWTSVKLITNGETLEVPVLAQWSDTSTFVPTSPPIPTATLQAQTQNQATMDLAKMIDAAMGISPTSDPSPTTQGRAGSNTDAEILDQLDRFFG